MKAVAKKSDPNPDAQLKSLASAVTRNLSASAKAFVPTSLPVQANAAPSTPAAAVAVSKPLGVTTPPSVRVQHGFSAPPLVSPSAAGGANGLPRVTPPRSSLLQSHHTPTSAGVKLSFAAAAASRPTPSPSKPKLIPATATAAAPMTPPRGPPTNPRELPTASPGTAQTTLALLQGASAAPASRPTTVSAAVGVALVMAAPVPRRPALIPDESPIKPLVPSPIKVPVPLGAGSMPVKEHPPRGNVALSSHYVLHLLPPPPLLLLRSVVFS
jgi:hypothetical protein